MLGSLTRLKGLIERPAHTYRQDMETFPNLDVDKIVASLNLLAEGRERGERDEPDSASTVFDAVETKILEHLSTEQKRAHGELEDRFADFRQRLIDLDFESHFSGIKDVALGGLADLKGEHQMGLDDLYRVRKDFIEAEKYLQDFKADNKIKRPPKQRSTASTILKWLLILLLLAFEILINGFFLGKGAELGLAQGIAEAAIVTTLNVLVPVFLALKLIPGLYHRNWFFKLWGLAWLAAFLVGTFTLNLGLAHYREAGAFDLLAAGPEVIERLRTRPFDMDDFQSWMLFAAGIFASCIALADGLSMVDRFPGFQAVADAARAASKRYALERQKRITDLLDLRQEYQDAVTDLRGELTKRRTEHEAIIAHRTRQLTLFREHQNQIERAGNAVFRAYRDANSQSRKTPPPARFVHPFQLNRIEVHIDRSNEIDSVDLTASIKEAQADLQSVMATLTKFVDDALETYKKLDILEPA